jgi:hypothetical protein
MGPYTIQSFQPGSRLSGERRVGVGGGAFRFSPAFVFLALPVVDAVENVNWKCNVTCLHT